MIKALPSKLLALVLLISQLIFAPVARSDEIELTVQSQKISQSLVESSRGAALAVLRDGNLLLGGGTTGNLLYHYRNSELVLIGELSTQAERIRDPRFGPTDIGILRESKKSVDILVSYPQLNKSKNCVRLLVFRYRINLEANSLSKEERWFQGKPCVPLGYVQHAAGRIEIIDSKSAYLTTGDLGFRQIGNVSARGWLGGVFKITSKKITQISQGHRNPQGILTIGKDLYISEHGPRGGDELNLIEKSKDYGWPFVTYGQPYSSGDYVIPNKSKTHIGYQEPIYYWVPSVAPTELIYLPKNKFWADLGGQIVMGTLAGQSLIFIELLSPQSVGLVKSYPVGERIRDLDLLPSGQIVATTDGGKLLFISPTG